MGSSFLEFFDRLQPVQVDAQQVAEGTGPSAAAINAASAAPVRRRSSGPAAPNQNDAGTSGDQQPEPMRTEGMFEFNDYLNLDHSQLQFAILTSATVSKFIVLI